MSNENTTPQATDAAAQAQEDRLGRNMNPSIADALARAALKLTPEQEANRIQRECQQSAASSRTGTGFTRTFGR